MANFKGRRPLRWLGGLACSLALAPQALATRSAYADDARVTADAMHPSDGSGISEDKDRAFSPVGATLVWMAAQAIPSPELAAGDGAANAGLRWEVTPLLYSFGLYGAHSRLKALLVEPAARHSGSVELTLSPEFLGGVGSRGPTWLGRAGARLYLPLVSRGETLSLAFGGSAYVTSVTSNRTGGSIEAGLFVLFGFVGLLETYSPGLRGGESITTVSLRFF